MPETHVYSKLTHLLFWLLWIAGLLVLLLFVFFVLLTLAGAPWTALWNALMVAANGYLLARSASHLRRADRPASTVLLLAGAAAVAVPLLASGGCLVLSNLGAGLRLAG